MTWKLPTQNGHKKAYASAICICVCLLKTSMSIPWLSKELGKSYSTDVGRTKLIKKFFGESTLIMDIKPEKIEKFKDFLIDEGRSKTTVNRYLEQLHTAFKLAVDNGYLLKNPSQSVKKFPVKNYTVRYLKEDEEERLLKVLPEYLKRIVLVALNTGLRDISTF